MAPDAPDSGHRSDEFGPSCCVDPRADTRHATRAP